jgi:hypothetical protein
VLLLPDLSPADLEAALAAHKPSSAALLGPAVLQALTAFYGKRPHWGAIEQYLYHSRAASENAKAIHKGVADTIEDMQCRILENVQYANTLQEKEIDPIKY